MSSGFSHVHVLEGVVMRGGGGRLRRLVSHTSVLAF